ncbi:hypothetical protein I4U23_030723 [Adineta vaga]|nr:hypothetical protein I4U23_030723 [Adineta vaga]
MHRSIASLIFAAVVLVLTTYAQDYTKLQFADCGSKSTDIINVDIKPMPLYNPGPAFFSFNAILKRPVKTVKVSLDIIRSVNGIKLPVKCYIVNGQNVGSCTYPDLCAFLQGILTEFSPENCPAALAEYGIDCTCPFDIKPQTINLIDHPIDLPDATQTAATFLASGNFNMTVTVSEVDPSAPAPYGCGKVAFTVKQKK